jgi:hypothetical protein
MDASLLTLPSLDWEQTRLPIKAATLTQSGKVRFADHSSRISFLAAYNPVGRPPTTTVARRASTRGLISPAAILFKCKPFSIEANYFDYHIR